MGLVLAIFAQYLILIGFIYKVSKDADDAVSPQYAANLKKFLKGESALTSYNWLPDFNKISDSFFGAKIVSTKAFKKSCFISFSVSLLLLWIFSNQSNVFVGIVDEFAEYGATYYDLFQLYGLVLTNLFVDFYSLCQTRIVMKTNLDLLIKVFVDAGLTILALPVGLYCFLLAESAVVYTGGIDYRFAFDGFVQILSLLEHTLIDGNFHDTTESGARIKVVCLSVFISTLSTSIWLWFHALTLLVAKPIKKIPILAKYLNVDAKPFFSFGLIMIFFVTCATLLIFPLAFAISI